MTKFTAILILCLALGACKHESKTISHPRKPLPERIKPKKIGYHFENPEKFLAKENSPAKTAIVLAVNRTDRANLAKMDSILIPEDLSGDIAYYMPFPLKVSSLRDISKIILFSYKTQAFGAYEYGDLVRTGATNMGRKADKTPTGLFFTNWKAEKTTSTFNDEWDLKWNFNIENKLGVGWHQYELPGYPASHSCLRLSEADARYLYDWADQWVLADKQTVKLKGTPVIVFGHYDFDSPKPWRKLTTDPKMLDLSENSIDREVRPFLPKILAAQEQRENTVQ